MTFDPTLTLYPGEHLCAVCEDKFKHWQMTLDHNLNKWFCDAGEDLRYDCPIHGKIGIGEGECPEC